MTGFSLQTNKMFSGGLIEANGRSPKVSRVNALASASLARFRASISSIVPVSSRLSSNAIRTVDNCCEEGKGDSGGSPMNSGGSSNGSSSMMVCLILMSLSGRYPSSTACDAIMSSVSNPSAKRPKIACFLSKPGLAARETKNCDPQRPSAEHAIDIDPLSCCRLDISGLKYFLVLSVRPQHEEPPSPTG